MDSAWKQDSVRAWKMLENAAESPLSTAPKMIAGNHFTRDDEDLRSENALSATSLGYHS